MAESSLCINKRLPSEILQKIFLISGESLKDVLLISTTCKLWRKLIFNPFMIEHYYAFDNEHRRKGLVQWWKSDENVRDSSNPFANLSSADCFLGKCVSSTGRGENSEKIDIDGFQSTIDRESDYTLAFWLLVNKTGHEWCAFMVQDTDWDYQRSAGVVIDETDFVSIAFASSISARVVKSNIQIKPNQWFHIVLVQEHKTDERTPRQTLWINGQLELTVEIPIAAYDSSAVVSFPHNNQSFADVSLWSRCLAPLEIRAIFEQQTTIDKVNVANYIFQHLKD